MPAPSKSAANATANALALFYEKFPSLPDGIYLGLPEARYHADSALGSSNIRDLLKAANLFWHKSALNPKRKPDKPTPAKILGSATHKLLLEGAVDYGRLYVRGPWAEGDDLTPAEKGVLTKEAKKKLQEHQELLPADDYDFVLGCKTILDEDPDLKGCLDNALTEVSIFWTRPDDVRVKVRLDALKLRGIGDIKTIANERERDLEQACCLDITTYRYDIPAAHYSEGRRQIGRLLDVGRAFYWTPVGKVEKLEKLKTGSDALAFLTNCSRIPTFGFQFVFIPKKGAPDAWSCTLSQGNPLLDEAGTDIEIAIERFKRAMAQDGLDRRWMPRRGVSELYRDQLPATHGRGVRRLD